VSCNLINEPLDRRVASFCQTEISAACTIKIFPNGSYSIRACKSPVPLRWNLSLSSIGLHLDGRLFARSFCVCVFILIRRFSRRTEYCWNSASTAGSLAAPAAPHRSPGRNRSSSLPRHRLEATTRWSCSVSHVLSSSRLLGIKSVFSICTVPFSIRTAAAPFGWPVRFFWQITGSGSSDERPRRAIFLCVTSLWFLSLTLVRAGSCHHRGRRCPGSTC
jgi:hypothetical protein